MWNTEYSGKYTTNSKQLFHSQLKINNYTHITSPIRRIVDIINLILFQQQMNLFSFSEKALLFVEKWIQRIDFINESTRQIKKVQNKSNLISLKENVEGYIFSKISTNKYYVYLLKLKCYYSFSTFEDVEMYKIYLFKIHTFEDEDKLNRRIRLSFIN